MKRNKVLLGLYVGLLTLAGGTVNAQDDGNKFFEIGPANVGGHVSSLVLDRQDTNNTTLYAGAATGGLFVKSADSAILRNLYNNIGTDAALADALVTNYGIWHRVPYFDQNNREVSLPISCMTQGADNILYIGTGSDDYTIGSTYGKRSAKGSGIYRYNPANNEFKVIPTTANNDNFLAVNSIECISRDGSLYLFAATNSGLYRWVVSLQSTQNDAYWMATPTRVFTGDVDQIVISSARKTAYFTSGNQVYSIGDVTVAPGSNSDNPLNYNNISTSNTAFGGTNTAIKLAISHTATPYLYAMVIDENGLMEALYMTTNGQTWSTLTTSSVMPITYNSGKFCGAIAVDPGNPRRVAIGGTNVQVGEGFLEGGYYQWVQSTYSEFDLNGGDYMGSVYNNYSFVHSGIHQILPAYRMEDGERFMVYYFATDGGIYSTRDNFRSFTNENRGLNNIQVNGIAVSPDGTIISGANNNACPIIETHLDHNVDSVRRAQQELSWFNDGSILLNNDANVLWTGTGGAVAASAFQQLAPTPRRVIFTSSANANYGRAYADYLNYRNTVTWTVGDAFSTNDVAGGSEISYMSLWETDNNTVFNDSIVVGVDTLGYIFRKVSGNTYDTVWLALPGTTSAVTFAYRDSVVAIGDTVTVIDTIPVGEGRGGHFRIQAGDKAIFNSRANADYPFEYTFKAADINMAGNQHRIAIDSIRVLNPIQSRMLITGNHIAPGFASNSTISSIFMSWYPTDFTKVFDVQESASNPNSSMWWGEIFSINRSNSGFENTYPRNAVFSTDGTRVYVSAYNTITHKSMLFRLSGFENIDYSQPLKEIKSALFHDPNPTNPTIIIDTFSFNGSRWLSRPISSITVDNHNGQERLILTFEDYCDTVANVAIVSNPAGSASISYSGITGKSAMPAYCALVEDSTGLIFVGTEDGVYTSANGTSWDVYENLTGVPVTSIVQQRYQLPIRRNLTHTGISANNFVFAKTKWPRALYFGTYGRGIFMDMTYVTDTENEVSEPCDYNPVDIPTVHGSGINSVNLYPNPVYGDAHLAVNAAVAGNGVLRVYDLNGRCVMNRNLGHIGQGEHLFTVSTEGLAKGMYLINVIVSGNTATAKMMVR